MTFDIVALCGEQPGPAATLAAMQAAGPQQAAWCRLDSGPGRRYELLTAVLEHFGVVEPSP
ncbi:MAG: hypothetical protein GEU83_00945 [Pseudonocardiaceae bacterium]|nr:hypothetical protein [Pseudonocardiaceae bacterium]